MSGIIAYIGKEDACPIIVNGLRRLEYKGYDSAGITLLENNNFQTFKSKGKLINLELQLSNTPSSHIGMGHTRWATHGEPTEINAHPHFSSQQQLAIVHNGMIENHLSLQKELESRGHIFESDTDTEVFIHFIEDIQEHHECSLEEAVRIALSKVIGSYAIVIMDQENPNQLIAAQKGNSLVIGVGNDEYFIASDASPIIKYTNEVIHLQEDEIAIINEKNLLLKSVDDTVQTPYIETLKMELTSIEKRGFNHFMLKEIFEQPIAIKDCMRGRIDATIGHLQLDTLQNFEEQLTKAQRIIIVATGTSWHAGLVAEYFFEEYTRIPVEVEYASEFRYRYPLIQKNDVIITISQSGETADTLASLELAHEHGASVFSICNVVGSSIAKMADATVYTKVGAELGIASTKAFTAQVTVLYMIALKIALHRKAIEIHQYHSLLFELENIPQKLQKSLEMNKHIVKNIANFFKDSDNFVYLGRGYNYPVALEGALKMKEIANTHASGYPAAEIKHGPIALIDESMPVVAIATNDRSYKKIIANIKEVRARKGKTIAIVTEGDLIVPDIADYVIEVPRTHEAFVPLLTVTSLQLLAYYTAIYKGCEVDAIM